MFSKLFMTALVALVGLHVVMAGPVNTAAPTCPKPNTNDPLQHVLPTKPRCCTADQYPDPGFYTCSTPEEFNVPCPSDKPVIRCCYGADPFHPVYHCLPPN